MFAAVAWQIGSGLVAPACRAVGPAPDDLPAVATTLKSKSGSEVATWFIPAPDSTATIVLLHAIRGDRRSMLGHARWLHQQGYSVVMVDLQAHGESPGEHITVGHLESHDARAAVEFARQQNPNHRIGVIGRSLGGAAALLAGDLDIDALVLESVYPTIHEAVHNRVAMRLGWLSHLVTPSLLCQLRPRLGITPQDLRPIDHITQTSCPVLITSGDKDEHTPIDETRRLFEAAADPKEISVFENAAHADLLSHTPEQYKRDVGEFLSRYLNHQR